MKIETVADIKNKTLEWIGTCKGKVYPIAGHQGARWGVELLVYSFSTSALEGGGWSAPRPGRLTPGKDSVPIVQEAGWAPGLVGTCAKNLARIGHAVRINQGRTVKNIFDSKL
jgi:hypothetical protein